MSLPQIVDGTVLPSLHQRTLKAHLRSIIFLDEMPNKALITIINPGALYLLFDIILRATIPSLE